VLDLLTQPSFFPARLPVLTKQVGEPLRMRFALPPKRPESVVDTLSVRFHSEQFVLRRVVDELRWKNLFLCLLAGVQNDRSGLFFHAEVN
jgi:hypothetical protein